MEQMEHVHLLINVSVMKLTKGWNAQKVSYMSCFSLFVVVVVVV